MTQRNVGNTGIGEWVDYVTKNTSIRIWNKITDNIHPQPIYTTTESVSKKYRGVASYSGGRWSYLITDYFHSCYGSGGGNSLSDCQEKCLVHLSKLK